LRAEQQLAASSSQAPEGKGIGKREGRVQIDKKIDEYGGWRRAEDGSWRSIEDR
jgi:hypothetical protein